MNTEPQFLAGKKSAPTDRSRVVAEIIMVVNSMDPLAPYKASDDLVLDLVNVTAIIKNDPEDAGAAPAELRMSSRTIWPSMSRPGGFMLAHRPNSNDVRQELRRLSRRRDKA
jgi:hypothetical protein